MIEVKTETGFNCKIDENVVNKYSFVRTVAKVEKNPTAVTDLVNMLLGDQEDALIEHLGGDPDASDIINEISYILNAITENNKVKKS